MTCEKMNTKVRLVRCPKCQSVLPELPEISVYKCGGCNTVLQAKHRKPNMKEADQNHESDENGLKEPDGVSNSTPSNENSAISTLDESSSSPRTSKIKDDNISDEKMNTKQSQDEDSPLSPVRIEHEKDNTVSIPDSGQFENEFPTSTELTSNEMEDSSIELQNILGTENDTDDQYTEADETKREKTKRDYFESSNFSDDVCSVMLDSSPESRKKDGILDSNESPQDFKHEDSSDHHLPVVESTNSELRGKDLDFTKSPTRSYYACDQVPNRSSKPPRRKLKPSNGPLKRAESGIPSLLSSETEMRYCGYNNKSGLDDDDGLMSSESEIQHLSRKATFLEANSMTKVPSNRYERRDSGFSRPDTALLYNNVPDKLELLKTINELKDELNRTRISNPSFPSLEENQHNWPCHHHHQPAPRFSRTVYSGEATGRANCTCFLPQARYYSGGVPLNGMCNYRTHHQFLQEHETKSQNVRQFPTQKDHSSKRYIIPEAGGIPILSCYHCSELLQFPADFLLSSRKCHKLKCNTCRKIMKFSLKNRRHLVPYIPEHTVAPPPSMVDDYSQTSLPQNSNIHSTVKPGISIDRSSSIKSERIARAPHEALKHGNMNKRNLTSGAFEPFNDDDHHHTRRNNSMETVGSSGNPKDLKEAPSTSGGAYRALHRLMGYASPSQVIRR